jgi:SAM-dependent MidA family methyltransferase
MAVLTRNLAQAGGWLGFDEFMTCALYYPDLGYYSGYRLKFGTLPYQVQAGQRVQGSDFVTAPEISALFGKTLAGQLLQALQHTQTRELWEFGAGSGALAEQLLQALGEQIDAYNIVELSGTLRERQQQRLLVFGSKVRWVERLPQVMQGVVLGNEVLDAMPVKLLIRKDGVWHERGVALGSSQSESKVLVWHDRATSLRPPHEVQGTHDYLTEIHPQAEAFISSLAERLCRSERGGAAFFIDYGFPQAEYYHPQRHMGTLMCHRLHQADPDPLRDIGLKDITAHVNFTELALAAQARGLHVLGYCSQARFLINCGLPALLQEASLQEQVQAHKLIMEHEMGELFKVMGFYTGEPWLAMGFSAGDRTHTL